MVCRFSRTIMYENIIVILYDLILTTFYSIRAKALMHIQTNFRTHNFTKIVNDRPDPTTCSKRKTRPTLERPQTQQQHGEDSRPRPQALHGQASEPQAQWQPQGHGRAPRLRPVHERHARRDGRGGLCDRVEPHWHGGMCAIALFSLSLSLCICVFTRVQGETHV